ncbi:MAG: DUF1768 domain-containing protein [Bacteroidetes bacterium]|nr:DUF1768 domain-containing protein [Bacteroidota bacterium]
MVYIVFKKSEGESEQSGDSLNPDVSEPSPSLGHRVTLFTTNHDENRTASEDTTRIVLPVSLGHPAGTGTAAGKWQQRRAVNIAFDLPDLGGSAAGAKIPSGPIRDFWAASTPTAEHLNVARIQQQKGGVSSRLARKQMEKNIGSYVTPENVHDKLSSAVDAIKDENSAIQRVGMACFEDLSNEDKFCHRRIIAKGLSDKLGVPIPDIFHISQLQKETGNTDQPLKYFEDTILHPMRAIAEREGLDLSKDKDALKGIFQKEIPAFDRLNQIISHWDSQKEEPLTPVSNPGAPSASPQITDQLDNSKDTSIQHDYPHANITKKNWKSIFSNFSLGKILYTDGAGKQLLATSSEALYQALKLKPDPKTGGLSQQAKAIALMKPRDAKNASRLLYQQSPDVFFSPAEFEVKKIESMKRVLQLKAEQHPEFLDALLATGNEQIVESTGNRDPYWGVIDTPSGQKGRNVLGKLLMQIRDEIRTNQQSAPAAPVAPASSPEVKEGIKGDITNPDFQKSGGYNMIVNTCNTVLNSAGVPVMGAGIAKDFRDKYKDTDYLDAVAGYLYPRNMTVAAAQRRFGAKWRHVDPAPGSIFVHQPKKADGTPFGPPIASLFVKRHWRDQARRDDTNRAITALKEYLDNNPSPDGKPWKVAMPHISGLNGERGNPVEGSVGQTGGWSATRQHIIDTFGGSPHEAHIIDFDGGAQSTPSTQLVLPTMTASVPTARQVIGPQSEVPTVEDALNHPSVKDPRFQRELLTTDWQRHFDESVATGYYSKFLSDLRISGKTPQQLAAISLMIRQGRLRDLIQKNPAFAGSTIDSDGSTVLVPNAQIMQHILGLEPSTRRIMVGNHGVYVEHETPQVFANGAPPPIVRTQYDEYRANGIKYYKQTKNVNYAEYKPGQWYSSIDSYINFPHEAGNGEEIPDTKDDLDITRIHTYPNSEETKQAWKPIFSNLYDSPIPFQDRVTKERLIAKSAETLYQAAKFKKNADGSLSEICKRVLSGTIKGLPGTESLPQNPSSLQISNFVYDYLKENPDQREPTFEDRKLETMKNILLLKAKNNKAFADALLDSGTNVLVASTWNRADSFWGASNVGRADGTQQGRNVLGKLLMQIRDELFPLKSSVAPAQQVRQPSVDTNAQLDGLKQAMSQKGEPLNKLFSKAVIGEDGHTVELSRLDRNFFENREPGFSRLIATPSGLFIEIHNIEAKTTPLGVNDYQDGQIIHERESPPFTRSTHIFLQTQNRDGFIKGKWYAPLKDYLPI